MNEDEGLVKIYNCKWSNDTNRNSFAISPFSRDRLKTSRELSYANPLEISLRIMFNVIVNEYSF